MKFDFYSDPAHGWLKVPIKLLDELGISEQITAYSYRRGDWAYLEEDLDAVVFIDAMKGAGKTVLFRERDSSKRSKIRGYARFTEVL